MIDVFRKCIAVVPIRSKEPRSVLAGIMGAVQNMRGKPQRLHSDEGVGLKSKVVKEYLDKEDIEIHLSKGYPNFAERGIRPFKDKLLKRVETDEKQGKDASAEASRANRHGIRWTDYIFEIVLTHNNEDKQTATGMTPKESAMKNNELEVKSNDSHSSSV